MIEKRHRNRPGHRETGAVSRLSQTFIRLALLILWDEEHIKSLQNYKKIYNFQSFMLADERFVASRRLLSVAAKMAGGEDGKSVIFSFFNHDIYSFTKNCYIRGVIRPARIIVGSAEPKSLIKI